MADNVKIAMRRRRETVRSIARTLAELERKAWVQLRPINQRYYLASADKIVSKVQRRMKDWSW